jgi:hypothetical protein
MAFLDSLEAIRKRPEKERKRIALMWTVALMFFVVVFWLATFTIARMPGSTSEKKPSAIGQALSGAILEIKKGTSVIGEQVKGLQGVGTVETK